MPNAAPPMLDDMAIFVEVVDAGGFTAASERLGLRKSTVSRRITALEEHLGARLLERTTRKLRLTEAGQEYHARCSRIVAEAREANQAVADARGTPRGTLRIATTQLFAETFLPPILAAYLARYRFTEVEIEFSQAKVDLVAGGFDLAIRIGPLQDSSLIARPLGKAMTGCFASPAYLRERGTPRAPGDLRTHDCILVGQSGSKEEWPFAGPEGARTISVSGRLRVGSLRVGHAIVRAGLGIARLPTFLVMEDVRAGLLVPVLAEWTPPSAPIHAVYPSNRQPSPKLQAFLDILRDKLAEAPWMQGNLDTPGPFTPPPGRSTKRSRAAAP
jgi:DNA-binding transcriptional LysR family regulator